MVSLYTRLYFLSSSQSVPPQHPPHDLLDGEAIFECLSPLEAEAIIAAEREPDASHLSARPSALMQEKVNRCYLQKCNGRWKPARARHCSTCGTCRMGFDHHCAVFANCLTVAHVPTFLCMVVLVPPIIFILSSPVLLPLAGRAAQAWRVACDDPSVSGWWSWGPSWIVAGGPVGRWVGGLVLGWRRLDRLDGGGIVRTSVAALVGIGGILSVICMVSHGSNQSYSSRHANIQQGLASTAISLIRSGRFTIDRERARMHSRAVEAVLVLQKRGQAVPEDKLRGMDKWAERRWFSVPTGSGRVVLATLPHEQAYNLGEGNWHFILRSYWGWLLPWRALRLGMREQDMMSWPLNTDVERRLRADAAAHVVPVDTIDL